jgi:hypothetical protein
VSILLGKVRQWGGLEPRWSRIKRFPGDRSATRPEREFVSSPSSWFGDLFGFAEGDPDLVRASLELEGTSFRSRANGRSFEFGRLDIPALDELRRASRATGRSGLTTLEEWVIDARSLHETTEASGALIQVASQFNLLEMIGPSVTPEQGITRYADDPTQGPACAIAAAAGTVYRCHFVPLDGGLGQARHRQIDCLAGLGQALGNHEGQLWEMVNGYALPTETGLSEIAARIEELTDDGRDELMGRLEIGLQCDTEVTSVPGGRRVSQAYCSALPIAYSQLPESSWESFARLVLDGAYEATLAAGALNAERTGNPYVFLTLLGGGAFGNRSEWIFDSLRRALSLYREAGLRVVMVSYRVPDRRVRALESWFRG